MLRIVIMVVALAAGGGAAWLAYSMIGEDGDPVAVERPDAIPTQEVLVAAAPTARGDELGPANLAWTAWPDSALGEGMILRADQPDALETHTGWIARSPLLSGEPLRIERLAEGRGGLMSLMVTPGMRAAALRVSAESGAGGFIMPNDRVDIIHTVTRDVDHDGDEEPVSTTIIRNVRVLAVDQIAEDGEAGAAVVAETATLELTLEQVELLTTASNSGRLSLALRSIADFGETEFGDIAYLEPHSGSAADRIPHPSDEQAAMAHTEGPDDLEAGSTKPVRITIIRSGQVETVQIDRNE